MIPLLALSLVAITGAGAEGINYYDIPARFDFSYTTGFNTVVVVGTNIQTQTYNVRFSIDGVLRGNKNVLPDGSYNFGFKPETCKYTVSYNNPITGTASQIYQNTGAYAGYSIPIEDFASGVTFYDNILWSSGSSSFRFSSSMSYQPIDDDIFSFTLGVTQTMSTNRSQPANIFYHTVDYTTLYNQCMSAYKGYINIDYQQGYQNGFYEGERVGTQDTIASMEREVTDAYNEGYDLGHTNGYQEGVVAGNNKNMTLQKLFWSVIDEPFAVIYRLLNFDVLGVNVFAFASGLVTLGLIGFVIKFII